MVKRKIILNSRIVRKMVLRFKEMRRKIILNLRVVRRMMLSVKEVRRKMMLNRRVLMRKKWSMSLRKQGEKGIVHGLKS